MTEQQRLWSVVPLVAIAGAVDAIGWLRMDEMFVGIITGNTTLLGVAIADGDMARAGRLALLVALFAAGAFSGAYIGHFAGRWRVPVVLSTVAALFLLGTTLPFEGAAIPAAVYALSPAMGMVNTAVPGVGGITFLTGTTVRGMQGLVLSLTKKATPWSWAPHVAAVFGLMFGAMLGALLEVRFGHWALLVPALFAAAGAGLVVVGSQRGWPAPRGA